LSTRINQELNSRLLTGLNQSDCKLHHVILSSCAFRPRQQLNDRLDQDSSNDIFTITINTTQREKSEWYVARADYIVRPSSLPWCPPFWRSRMQGQAPSGLGGPGGPGGPGKDPKKVGARIAPLLHANDESHRFTLYHPARAKEVGATSPDARRQEEEETRTRGGQQVAPRLPNYQVQAEDAENGKDKRLSVA
jgi:hypothetical protein